MKTILHTLLLAGITTLLLSGCGGSDPLDLRNDAPRVHIVSSLPSNEVRLGAQVILTGRARDIDGEIDEDTYEWAQMDTDELKVNISTGENKLIVTFVTPEEFIGETYLNFVFSVRDKEGKRGSGTIQLQLKGVPNDKPVVAIIKAPHGAIPGSEVVMDGSFSHYDDSTESIATYHWEQNTTDETSVVLNNNSKAKASFIAPNTADDLDLHFTLTVTDVYGRMADKSVTVRISNKVVYSVSGKVSIKSDSHLDGDINDPKATYVPNNSLVTAQNITNPAQVVGYINRAGKGPAGRSKNLGDRADFYKFSIRTGQKLRIQYFAGDIKTAQVDKDVDDSPKVLLETDNNFDLYIYDDAQNLVTRFDTLHYCKERDKDHKPDAKACAELGPEHTSLIGSSESENNYIETLEREGKEHYKLQAVYDFKDVLNGDSYVQVYAGLGAGNYKLSLINSDGSFESVPQALSFGVLDVILFDPYDYEDNEQPETLYSVQARNIDQNKKNDYKYLFKNISAAKYLMWASVNMDNDEFYSPFFFEPIATPLGLEFGQLDVEEDIENQDYDLEINVF